MSLGETRVPGKGSIELGEPSNSEDGAHSSADVPSLSLIVAVDAVHEGTARSLRDMLAVVGDASCEVIVASREAWPAAPDGVTVVSYNAASRGDRFDRAAAEARGRILAFVDDRVRLPKGWADRVIDYFDNPSVSIAGGPVLPRSRWRAERISALILNSHLSTTPSGHVSRAEKPRTVSELTGSNLLIREDVFRDVGGFQSPTVGGEAVRLCYKVRSILGCDINYESKLAVAATTRRFPGPFLRDTAAYGRARGDMARRFREVAPFYPYALPTLLTLFVLAEIVLAMPFTPFRHVRLAEYIGASLLVVFYVVQAVGVLFAKGPFRPLDRLLATLGLPLVSLTYGVAFVRGFFGPSLGEISPLRGRLRPVRVLIINWRDISHPWSGGAETYMHEIGRRLAENGMDVGWLTQRHRGSSRNELLDGIRVHRVGGRFTLYPRVVISYLFKLRGRYDVIVDCENGIPFFTPLFARIPKVLLVHHVHREIFRRETHPPLRWLGYWLEGWLMPKVYKKTPIIAVSASTRDDLVGLGFRAEQIHIVHNGVLEVSPLQRNPATEPRILCAGRLTPQKGVDVIIRAMPIVLRSLPNARLDIVGQGPDRTRLERLAWSLKLATHVRFHGYLPGAARDQLAAQAWVAVCPSAFEGWGVSCVEAGARGLPVIASNVNGLRDSVRDGVTGLLVPHGDPRALAEAVVGLLGDPDLREAMSVAGIDWAASHSWERSTNELRIVLAGAIDANRLGETLVVAPAPVTDVEAVEEVQISNAG
jgi:glycosyltransferase involved in cell wall biosynthesis